MKHLFTFGITAMAIISTQAQEVKFGKYTAEEIAKTKSSITPSASAEVLFSSAKYKIDWDQISGALQKKMEITYRIKIYDKDKTPDNILSLEIPIRNGSSKADTEKVVSLKASTFNLEGNSLKEYKVEKKDIFTKTVHDYLKVQTLTFPNVKNGSIIEYTYEISSPFYYNTDTWYFQENIPVVKSILTLDANESLKYTDDFRGQYILTPKRTTRTERVTVKQGGFSVNDFDKKALSQATYDYQMNQTTYVAENLPGYEKEAYVLNPRNLLSSVRFELGSYEPRNGTAQTFSTTWERIGKDLMDHESFGRQLNGNGFLEDKVKELTASGTSGMDKITAIYNFVRDNYKWDKYNSIYTDKGIRKTFNDKTGNVADINMMLVAMLEKAGFKANPVVLSTVQNGMLNYVFPSKAKLNYVIASVNIDGKDILMDATNPFARLNLLPMNVLNHRGILIAKDGVREIELVNTIMSTDKTQVIAKLSPEGQISGTYNNYHDNYFYINDKSQIQEDPKAFEKEFVEDYSFDIESFRSLDNDNGLLRHSFKFDGVQADAAGNKIIFNPLLFDAMENHNLNYDTRNYNIEFGSPMTIQKSFKIKIPDGYKVESLPKAFQKNIMNDAAAYAYQIEEKDGFIEVYSVRVLPYSVLPSNYYKPLKELMNTIVEAETQQVVLVKS